MPTVEDKFLSLRVKDTRCPAKIHGLAPSATTIYVLRQRFDCRHWQTVQDLFSQVNGAFIVTTPVAARKHFTLHPKEVIARLTKAGVW